MRGTTKANKNGMVIWNRQSNMVSIDDVGSVSATAGSQNRIMFCARLGTTTQTGSTLRARQKFLVLAVIGQFHS